MDFAFHVIGLLAINVIAWSCFIILGLLGFYFPKYDFDSCSSYYFYLLSGIHSNPWALQIIEGILGAKIERGLR